MVYWNITQVVIIFFLLVSIPYHFNPNPMQLYLWEHRKYYLLAIVCCLAAPWFNFLFFFFYSICFHHSHFTHKHTYIQTIYSNVLRWLFSQISITFILVLLSFLLEFHSVCRSSHLLFFALHEYQLSEGMLGGVKVGASFEFYVYFLHMRQNDVCTCKKYQKCIICLLLSLHQHFFAFLHSFLPSVSCVYFKCWHSFLSNSFLILLFFTFFRRKMKSYHKFQF